MEKRSESAANAVEFKDVIVRYYIVSIDFENMTGVVGIAVGSGKFQVHSVQVSGLLIWKLRNDTKFYQIGKTYASSMCSRDKSINPLQVIRYTDKSGVIKLLLACVHQRSSKKLDKRLPNGDIVTQTVYSYWGNYQLCRWRDNIKTEETKEKETKETKDFVDGKEVESI